MYQLLTSNPKIITLVAGFVLASILALLLVIPTVDSSNVLTNVFDFSNNFTPNLAIAYADGGDGGPVPPPPDP